MQALETIQSEHRIRGEWLRAPETVSVMSALHAGGAQARFVGGCVRDALIGRAVNDIDIAVDIPPDMTIQALEAAEIKAIPTGLQHGTITAVIGERSFEITTLRTDLKTDGRHAEVAFTQDWLADAKRRDFTMNALYADADGTIHDPLSSGIADVIAERVSFIGDARARIEEDFLRILRLFRFHAWYGQGEMEPDAIVAAAGLAGGIVGLSRERVGQEMRKLLSAPKPAKALETMSVSGVLAHTLPFAKPDAPFAALSALELRFGVTPAFERRLALLCWDVEADQVAQALRLSNNEFRELKLRRAPRVAGSGNVYARRLGYKRGEAAARDVILNQAAWEGGEPSAAELHAASEGARFELPVTSADILGLGIAPGPMIGDGLGLAEERWIESDFTLDKVTLLAHVESRLKV